jgi:hypothetical protein
MKINFKKLQQLIIEKIKAEENIVLKAHEVKFQVEPNYTLSDNRMTFKILIFGQQFLHGYADHNNTEPDLISDCFSRLHDYGKDSVKWHIWSLKILDIELRYGYQFDKIRDFLFDNIPDLKPRDISIQISDISAEETDENGFPKYGLYIEYPYKTIEIELDIYNYDYQLLESFIEKF